MKATEQYFPVVLFIMLYKVVLTFRSVDEILWCDRSNESYWAVLSCRTVYYYVQGDSNFGVCGRNPMVWPFNRNLFNRAFAVYFLLLHKTKFDFLGEYLLWPPQGVKEFRRSKVMLTIPFEKPQTQVNHLKLLLEAYPCVQWVDVSSGQVLNWSLT